MRIFDLRLLSKYQHSKYTWNNQNYREFMTDIIFGLEPIRYERDSMILEELDEVDKVVFCVTRIKIGYTINREPKYRIAL